MVVDDDTPTVIAVANLIDSMNHNTILTRNGAACISYLEKNIPDLILLYIRMPEKDGYEIFFEIRKKYPEIKVIFMTGFEDYSRWEEAKKQGALDLVAKPFKISRMTELINIHCKN